MALDARKNFAKVLVDGGFNDSATSVTLQTGEGAKLPDPAIDGAFNLVWFDVTNYADPADDPAVEIVRVTARSTDTLTVTRAQEGTSASAKNTSLAQYLMVLGVTAKVLSDIQTALDAKASLTGTETLTNKRINPRTSSTASTATLTPSLSTANVFYVTAQAAALEIAAPTGTPVIGETISINIKDNGTARALTINAAYKFLGAAGPTTTTINKWLTITAQYNGTDWLAAWAGEV